MSSAEEKATIVDEFFVRNHCRLHVCPGDLKHPGPAGYAESVLYARDVQQMLNESGERRYCWLLDDHHLVIDIDMHPGGANGHAAFEALCADLGIDLMDVCGAIVESPSGGRHLYFRIPPDSQLRSLNVVDKHRYAGLDTITKRIRNNALLVAPGSTHPDVPGLYHWRVRDDGRRPELVDCPEALLQLIRVPEAELPRGDAMAAGDEKDRSPGDRFACSWTGVQWIAALLSEQGYTFNEVTEGDSHFFEYRRGGKTTAAKVSGYLGKTNRNGRHQWTNFSLSDKYLEAGETVNILEGLRRILHEGNRDGSWAAVMAQLSKWDFGIGVDEAFAGALRGVEQGPVAGDGGEVKYTASGFKVIPGLPAEFWNYTPKKLPPVGRGAPKVVQERKSQDELIAPFLAASWPKSVAGIMYVPAKDGLRSLMDKNALFTWLSSQGEVNWPGAGQLIDKGEFFATLNTSVEKRSFISPIPTFPLIDGVLYDCGTIDDPALGDGSTLEKLLDFFQPADAVNRQLIKAMAMTLVWGGPAGQRPAFLIDSVDGVGTGKTALVAKVGQLLKVGPQIVGSEVTRMDTETLYKRVCEPGNESRRVLMFDNVRGASLSSTTLESLITVAEFNGDVKFSARRSVPNYFTVALTINGGSLNRDMSSRCVRIQVKKPTRNPNWDEAVDAFIRDNHRDLMADFRSIFARPATSIAADKLTRMATWCREIVGRLDDPEAVLDAIHGGQAASDADAVHAEDLKDAIEYQLRLVGVPENVFISSEMMKKLAEDVFGEKFRSVKASSGAVNALISKGSIKYMEKRRITSHGVKRRGYVFLPIKGGEETVQDPFPSHRDLG